MAQGTIRHVFPGGNTPKGFFSYYNYIIPTDARRIFVLKGGPGTGKSTFMKRMGQALADSGYDVEFHHCSSDNNSLDGIVIPALEVAFIDGTAPHIVDPKNPGCVDEILNLGAFWNEPKMVDNKRSILDYNQEIASNFQRAYRLLNAAKSLYDDWEAVNVRAMNFSATNRKTQELLSAIFAGMDSVGCGKVRKLFGSAISPDGAVNYLYSVINIMPKCYVVKGEPGTGKSTLLQKVVDTAVSKGLDVEAFYCPLDPEKVEHLVIPALGVACTTSSEPHLADLENATQIIDMNECRDEAIVTRYADVTDYNRDMFWSLFHRCVSHIKMSKKLHDDLETCYIPNMDFSAIEGLWQQTLNRVIAYGKS